MKDQRLLQMQVFRAVVEYDGFTAAAYALESSQPFVSRTIAQLERRLGAKLTNVEDVLNPKTLKPAGLHVQAPNKYELAINRKTAKAPGLTVPPNILARAHEVIE